VNVPEYYNNMEPSMTHPATSLSWPTRMGTILVLSSFANNRLSWKGIPGTNFLPY